MLVPKLRFKEFKNDFEKYKLEDIVSFYKGNNLSKSDIIENGTYPCILYGELYTKYSEVAYTIYSKTNSYTKNQFTSKQNDVLIPCSGETAIDISTSTCLLEDNILIGGDLNVLRPVNQNGKYLSYLLCNKKRNIISKYAQGDSIVHLYGDKIKNININIPSISEQEKIANFLSLLDQKIKLQQRKIETLKIYKKGLIHKLFNENKNNSKVRINEFLTEIFEKSTINNQYDVISSTKDFLILQKEYFKRNIASNNNIGYKILRRNQIVLSPQNLWMGNINFNNKYEIGIVSPSYKIFNINSLFDKYYISNLLKTEKAFYLYTLSSEQGASIVRRNLNIEAFNEISFHIPDIDTQKKYGNIIQIFSNKLQNENNKLYLLINLKKSLLQQLFI